MIAACVELLPEPVGPVTSTRPLRNSAISVRCTGNPRRLDRGNVSRDDAHHDRVNAALLKDIDAKTGARRQRITEIGGAGARETFGGVGISVNERERDDLGLIRGKLLHPEGLDGSQLAVDFDLRGLSDGEIQVADLVGDQQHSLNNGR